jgi:hypothetical protein
LQDAVEHLQELAPQEPEEPGEDSEEIEGMSGVEDNLVVHARERARILIALVCFVF